MLDFPGFPSAMFANSSGILPEGRSGILCDIPYEIPQKFQKIFFYIKFIMEITPKVMYGFFLFVIEFVMKFQHDFLDEPLLHIRKHTFLWIFLLGFLEKKNFLRLLKKVNHWNSHKNF